MGRFEKPQVVVSKCLGFAKCRYNGQIIHEEFIERIRPYVNFLPVCPEVEIGLGIPRDPVRIVFLNKKLRLMQPSTGHDVTEKMDGFAISFFSSIGDIDGFILKNRSPSCGIKDVKVYPGMGKVASISRTSGFFGGAVLNHFQNLAIEDEGRLKNFKIRDHFLTKLFSIVRFKKLKNLSSFKSLEEFHSKNKLLLMAYNEKELGILDKIVENHDKKPISDLVRDYEQHFLQAFSRSPSYTSIINVLLHVIEHFSNLNQNEKALFLDSIQKYRSGIMSLCGITTLIKSWIIRFNEDYLEKQTFFDPYPEDLVTCFLLTDSEKMRN